MNLAANKKCAVIRRKSPTYSQSFRIFWNFGFGIFPCKVDDEPPIRLTLGEAPLAVPRWEPEGTARGRKRCSSRRSCEISRAPSPPAPPQIEGRSRRASWKHDISRWLSVPRNAIDSSSRGSTRLNKEIGRY